MLDVFAAIFCLAVISVLLIAMCTHVEEPPPKPVRVKQNPQMNLQPEQAKPIFQTDLEEVSENVTFHVIEGGKPNLCFPMDNYYGDDVPEPPPPAPESPDWKTATYRSYALSSVRGSTETVKKPEKSSSTSYEYEEDSSSYYSA